MRQTRRILAGAALLSGLMMGAAFANTYHFKLADKIALPTKPGHGDWVAYDPGNHDVYVSLHGSGMAVVDTKTNKVIADIKDIAAPNTMSFDNDYIYETAAEGPGAGKKNQIVVIDKKTWKVVDRVNTAGTSPDGTFIDKANNRLYVVMDDDNSIDIYSTGAHPKFIKKLALYPANSKEGPDVANLYNGTIYATDDAWVVQVNPNTGALGNKVNYHVKLTKFGGTKDMFLDRVHNRLWVATTTGGVLIVNPKTLSVEKRLKESSKTGADAVAWDKKLGLVYVFEGGLPGFDVYSINKMTHVATVKTGSKKPTHSGAVDPATHKIYAYAGGDAALYVYNPEK